MSSGRKETSPIVTSSVTSSEHTSGSPAHCASTPTIGSPS